jgi:alkyldihydroxyacetonephosphate synthase
MGKKDEFYPPWCEQEAPPQSFRSLIKYGDSRGFKHPNRALYELLKEALGLSDEDFKKPKLCMEPFDIEIPLRLAEEHIKALRLIVGEENLFTDTYSRTRASYGAGIIDALRLRQRVVENIADVVLCPGSQKDLEAVVRYCHEHRIPVYVSGGGSSVTRGKEAVKGGVSLDMSVHLNKILAFNEANQTVTVQAGIWGPELERALNNAPKSLGAKGHYTCGHFPVV